MIIGRNRDTDSDIANAAEAIRGTFAERHEQLKWLALFLTGNDAVAEACVVDACAIAEELCESRPGSRIVSPAYAAIDSAIQMQRARIAGLSPLYDGHICLHAAHEQLPAESLAFLVIESEIVCSRLDTLCRFVLVICGIEKFSCNDAARWLGIDPRAVEGAYCAALESLEVIDCEARMECAEGVSTWN